MMTARHMQLCDLCVVRLLLRHRPSWMFKPLDSIITPGLAHQSFWPIHVVRHSIISVSPRPFRESRTCADCDQVHESLNGYPRLGAFIASDRNSLIVRRFNHLQARLLLQVQDELRKFEAQLDAMDKGPLLACESLQFREMDDDLSGRRKSLLRKIEYPTAYF